jgi:hypothetical protein
VEEIRGYEGGIAGLNWSRRMVGTALVPPGSRDLRTVATTPVGRGGRRRGEMIRVSVQRRVGRRGGEVIGFRRAGLLWLVRSTQPVAVYFRGRSVGIKHLLSDWLLGWLFVYF